jgi:hypothetical protein
MVRDGEGELLEVQIRISKLFGATVVIFLFESTPWLEISRRYIPRLVGI